jgi:Tfp pilus assembly protein PilX
MSPSTWSHAARCRIAGFRSRPCKAAAYQTKLYQAKSRPAGRRNAGVVLVTCLVLLSTVMLASVAAAILATEGERGARLERDRQLAFQAAEAALADAERDIEGGAPAIGRPSAFAVAAVAAFDAACGAGDSNAGQGLCLASEDFAPWSQVNLADTVAASARTVSYGRFTGRALPARAGPLPKRLPRYLIEALPLRQAGAAADQGQDWLFRITAIGFGVHPSMRVVLQSYYRRTQE